MPQQWKWEYAHLNRSFCYANTAQAIIAATSSLKSNVVVLKKNKKLQLLHFTQVRIDNYDSITAVWIDHLYDSIDTSAATRRSIIREIMIVIQVIFEIERLHFPGKHSRQHTPKVSLGESVQSHEPKQYT
mmetsp:Transcript_16934/g.28369  ORF Transcript_16934/g.28369 Transcript_16934/m.28369 type:complete len:130 (+) Transcript_16934:947-1336(+)